MTRTIIQSPNARAVLGHLHSQVVGGPDDAVLFIYLNYVHKTFRIRQIGAVGEQVWTDTLAACVALLAKLRRDKVTRLLARDYEAALQESVLSAYDALAVSRPRLAA